MIKAVTGPKSDRWLVQTAELLQAPVDAGLPLVDSRHPIQPELVLAAANAGVDAPVDVVSVAKRRLTQVDMAISHKWARS